MNLYLFLSANAQVVDILFFVFIGIFILTALLTLLSLPGWVKLDVWYQKKLFLALIIEVVGVVITLFSHTFINSDNTSKIAQLPPKAIISSDSIWLNEKGINMFLDIITQAKDSSNTVFQELILDKSAIQSLKLFNSITLKDSQNESSAILKFRRDADNQNRWYHKEGEIIGCPYRYEVYDAKTGPNYRIIKDSDTIKNSFGEHTTNVFDKGKRKYLLYPYSNPENNEKLYYLYRVIAADLENSLQEKQFVDVFLLEIKSELNTEDL